MDNVFILPLPWTGRTNRQGLRAALISRVIYPIADDEDPEAFVALDTESGAVPIGLARHGVIFWLDEDDEITAHDDLTCIVTDDGYRYKVADIQHLFRSVLDKDTTSPPGSPSIGDRYLVPSAATGAWSGHGDEVAVYTARGWRFVEPLEGWQLLVEDENLVYIFDADGEWVSESTRAASSVKASHILGGRTHWVVVNAATNTPPTLTGSGVAYIIGGSPTGAWSGHTGKIAVDEGASWGIYTPAEGWTADDQAQNGAFRYSGSAWLPRNGASLTHKYVKTDANAADAGLDTGTAYSYSDTVAPVTSNAINYDPVGLAFAAQQPDAKLRIKYHARTNITSSIVALWRDNESSAIEWRLVSNGNTVDVEFVVPAPDDSEHQYKIGILRSGSADAAGIIARRLLQIEEFSPT